MAESTPQTADPVQASPASPRVRRQWSMPSRWTFSMPPVSELLSRYVTDPERWWDPFCGQSAWAKHRNDLRESGVDAREYLQGFETIENCLLDPPYSPRQIAECYQSVGRKIGQADTQNASLMREVRDLVADRMPIGGRVISCAWNSNGMGKGRGYEMEEILLVAHGGSHNDTIVVVESKRWER